MISRRGLFLGATGLVLAAPSIIGISGRMQFSVAQRTTLDWRNDPAAFVREWMGVSPADWHKEAMHAFCRFSDLSPRQQARIMRMAVERGWRSA